MNFPVVRQLPVLLALGLALPAAIPAQSNAPLPVQEIIQKFAANEMALVQIRAGYGYRQETRIQELDSKGDPVGEYRTVTLVTPDSSGQRKERFVYAPPSTLQRIAMTPQDLDDIRETQTFAFATAEIEKYDVKPAGRENVRGVSCDVFEVKPRKIENGERYFEGKVWVEDSGRHIVKTDGKVVPDIQRNNSENLFPHFQMYRELVDGYWLPASIESDDTLQFRAGPIHIRQITRFDSYTKF